MEAEQEGRRPPFLIRRLATEPELLARIEAAERLGIAPRRFDGWEPSTVYEYDERDRLVRSTPEPEWSDQDRAWMFALDAYRKTWFCPCGCGHPADETLAHESDGRTFVVPAPTRCRARTALSIAQERHKDTPQSEALLWRVERR